MVDTLPNEIFEYIFLYVEPCDLFSLRAVCWKWYEFITNEYFLNRYFNNRFGQHAKQFVFKWVGYHTKPNIYSYFVKLVQGVNTKYLVPAHLQGSGGVVLYGIRRGMAVLPVLTCSFYNRDYSISIWLHLDSNFDAVSFSMKLNGFLLELTLSK
ncbi:unnamed protein product [Adineta steineri]|uniref:F-box domain-containing protein n=1 Tax=Adineta steineri TaxID=433720 RepID=A0A818YDQ8_9BILA|nr:unnamed protein product [Adineta steineri]CAF0813574.1 unnamed protein product [Adineta steineri]CAF0979197.1 unnamed protein product [Adineta steineri]CAF3752879.1 unnamed protein product [Adineta steineri]CAF3927940.1 unnamed protein product [Adineta steineri]